jgi:hypothetical protein
VTLTEVVALDFEHWYLFNGDSGSTMFDRLIKSPPGI